MAIQEAAEEVGVSDVVLDLPTKLRMEADAMKAAIGGKCLHNTFHLLNWNDKPHRVVFDATKMMHIAADRVSELDAEATTLREAVKRSHQSTESLVAWIGETYPDADLPIALALMLIDSRQKREAALAALSPPDGDGR